ACTTCRALKKRCNGERPWCQNCLGKDTPCEYPKHRKDRLQLSLERNRDMTNLLLSLRSRVVSDDCQRVPSLPNKSKISDFDPDTKQSSQRQTFPALDSLHGETDVSAEVGSEGEADIIDEDLLGDEENRAIGFVGPGSEQRWLRRLQEEAKGPKRASLDASRRHQEKDASSPVRIASSTFYLDNAGIDIDYTIDAYGMPPMDTARRLFDAYMDTVHDSFPILPKTSFTDQFQQYCASVARGRPISVPEKWLATLNLVFAIGAQYLHLTDAVWRAGQWGHEIYHYRAHVLGIMGSPLVSNPDLMQVQITALLGFYFMSIGRVNRAWIVSGISLRMSCALGLHVRNEDPTATATQKEALLYTWWALYSLEGNLNDIAGRPSFIGADYCTAPLPLPLSTEQLSDADMVASSSIQYRPSAVGRVPWKTELPASTRANIDTPLPTSSEPSNAGSYLKSKARIGMITNRALTDLYSPRTVVASWKDVQHSITGFLEELEAWVASLPTAFNFSLPQPTAGFIRERRILEMHYFGTKILITRPCLCRVDSRIKNQSKTSDTFNKRAARSCTEAAIAMSETLPEVAVASYLYQTGPWWAVVHNLMQALIVLIIELSYGTVHIPEGGQAILPSIKKLIRWLRAMSGNNQVAARAYCLAFDVLQKAASQLDADISDL
ncbi:hypothetical protein BDV96DRAFT_457194, partial [Lophiotrema nucula]